MLGAYFERDHGTILWAVKCVTERCDVSEGYKRRIEGLRQVVAKEIENRGRTGKGGVNPTMEPKQAEMSFGQARARDADASVELMIERLRGRGWTSADALLDMMGEPRTEARRRWLRRWANFSKGEIASGQEGYKRVREMTAEEYNHFRNAMKSQADSMTRRILESDKVFYGRAAVATGNGIL